MRDLLFEGVHVTCDDADEQRKIISTILELGAGAAQGFIVGVSTVGELVGMPELVDQEREQDSPVVIGVDDVSFFGGFRLAIRTARRLGVWCDEDAFDNETHEPVQCAQSEHAVVVRDTVIVDKRLAEFYGITSSEAYVFKIQPVK